MAGLKKETHEIQRLKVIVRGAVQGVGFRPFTYGLAHALGLAGTVVNTPQGVFIEAEGPRPKLQEFLLRLDSEKPPHAFIQSLESSYLDPKNYSQFEILQSSHEGSKSTLIMPDIASCSACIKEIFDPKNKRYLYPFTNCTHCGPRFSIIESLPYDRVNTTMHSFTLCSACEAEYDNPKDRRFHAQPNACPQCGPQMECVDETGKILSVGQEALSLAAQAILEGKVVALKALGGFQLLCDASNDLAVQRLRQRKHREEKPLAVMVPDIYSAENYCEVSDLEKRLLQSPEAPIVLLQKKRIVKNKIKNLAPSIAFDNPNMGIFLPYTPAHHILFYLLKGCPVVATSGNLSEEPMAIEMKESLLRLKGVADLFLNHNRPIARHVDDSVARIVMDREYILRRARGYAPLPFESIDKSGTIILSVGAHLKNTVGLSFSGRTIISQHIGDLENEETYTAFQKVIGDLEKLYELKHEVVACDLHPEYLSTKYVDLTNAKKFTFQHHYAHILSCMSDNEITGPVLGVAWDGTGLGTDGTVWGGEFLKITSQGFTRVGSFRPFALLGHEKAIQEPRRVALALLYEIYQEALFKMKDLKVFKAFTKEELDTFASMLKEKIQISWTSSCGRLFDAISSLLAICHKQRFEGQAAMGLEYSIGHRRIAETYSPKVVEGKEKLLLFDWEMMIREILADIKKEISYGVISAKFHNTLAEIIVTTAKRIGEKRVVLSGGCFQNKYLLEKSVTLLKEKGFIPYWHQRIPPNDGGIALGQAAGAMRELKMIDSKAWLI